MTSHFTWQREVLALLVALFAVPVLTPADACAQPVRGPKAVDLPEWLKLDAEYRVQTVYIDPLDLSGTEITGVQWTEQRMRFDLGFR